MSKHKRQEHANQEYRQTITSSGKSRGEVRKGNCGCSALVGGSLAGNMINSHIDRN